MGNVEDVRKVIQDFVAPDLKAIEARLDALEKEMKLRFDHAEKTNVTRFEQAEKSMSIQFVHVGSEFASAEKMNQERMSTLQKFFAAQFDLLMATIAANHASVMSSWEIEKRLTRLESERKTEPQHA